MKRPTIKRLAKDAGISDANADRFASAMAGVKGVLDGTIEQPGGPGCRFPYCSCNSPWEKCEKEFRPKG